MLYRHHFTVQAPLKKVAEFHSRSNSMARITPPPVIVRLHEGPERLTEGDWMDFSLWLGPLPVHWLARIESVSEHGFHDRQLNGPFASWVHRHTFLPTGEAATQVIDEIEAETKNHFFWGLVGLLMWLSLPLLFAYRGWKTRMELEQP